MTFIKVTVKKLMKYMYKGINVCTFNVQKA